MRTIDINCDLGESFGNWSMGNDELVIPEITSANVACGFHASDPLTMIATVRRCHEHGVAIGAHPGLPDLLGFGRRPMGISPDDAYAYIVYQAGALQGIDHQHDFHQAVVGGSAGRLQDEDVLATNVLVDFDHDFAIGELRYHGFTEGNAEAFCDPFC